MSAFRIGMLVVGGLIAFPVLGGLYSVFSTVVTAPGRVINKTLETNNIISNYEWYHDANGQYKAKLGQIRQHKSYMTDVKDDGEKYRVRIELAAIQQSCRDLVNKYNANSIKINRNIFKGTEAPESLPENSCE